VTKWILLSAACGMLAGYTVIPAPFIEVSGTLLVVGLSILMFFVGIDLGMEGTVVANFKKVGFRIVIFPVLVILGTLAGAWGGTPSRPCSCRAIRRSFPPCPFSTTSCGRCSAFC
jgi:uncharacterized membrane protein YbjE (DUF340 family)